VDARKKLACSQRSQLSDLYYGRNRPAASCSCVYLVSADFVTDWKSFVRYVVIVVSVGDAQRLVIGQFSSDCADRCPNLCTRYYIHDKVHLLLPKFISVETLKLKLVSDHSGPFIWLLTRVYIRAAYVHIIKHS